MTEPLPVIELGYATPAAAAYSVRKAGIVRWLACVPPGVGLLILFGFACSGLEVFLGLGMLWLFLGGAWAFSTGVVGLVLFVQTRAPQDGIAHRAYGAAVVLSLLALPTAAGCVFVGLWFHALWHR